MTATSSSRFACILDESQLQSIATYPPLPSLIQQLFKSHAGEIIELYFFFVLFQGGDRRCWQQKKRTKGGFHHT